MSSSQRWLRQPLECGDKAGFGLYLHVPFCAHRCGYCDFATYDDRSHLIGRYTAALRTEVTRWAQRGPWPAVTSVFVGGGTPTLLPADDLAGVIAAVLASFDVAHDAEITVEANPETADRAGFRTLADAGVNRISLGAQSFAPHVLATLERRHDPDRVPAAVATARAAGIAQVNLDLIYGTPGETDADWAASLAAVLACEVDHVSAYALTVAANTAFGRAVAHGRIRPPDPDLQRRRFDVGRQILADAGFDHYEVSSWARDASRRSRHNLLYWRHGDYLGLGVGAHGHRSGRRWWNHRSIERWFEEPIAGHENLTVDERAMERLMLGLRVREGLHPADVPPLDAAAVNDAVRAGLLQLSCGRFQATADGWFLLDELIRRLA
ncbi:MAG: radical SAM family heme chaperone HemW [Actinomycetota bacterium]|nr:radical SAM family heme chaperone HemW [Actinomycetota bacterium]